MPVAYASSIQKAPVAGLSADIDVTAHHVKDSHGKTVSFYNPHPSAAPTAQPVTTILQMIG